MEYMSLYQLLSFFMIYAFFGWCTEVIFQALGKGIVVNRGFLNGPICPIYGCGVVSVLLLLEHLGSRYPETTNAAGIFVVGVFLATGIELFGGWILDKAFHARWWDYRDRKFNLNGYVCPQFALIWGFGILLVVRIVHPFIRNLLMLPGETKWGWGILIVLYVIFLADISTSVSIMVGLNKRFAELNELKQAMRVVSDKLSSKIGEESLDTKQKVEIARLEVALGKAELKDAIENAQDEIRDKIQDAGHELERNLEERKKELMDKVFARKHFGMGRMIFANPTFDHREYKHWLREIRNEFENKK